MAFGWLKSIFSTPVAVEDFAALQPGRAHLVGRAQPGDEPLRSPLKNAICVAYDYHARYAIQGRAGTIEHTLKGVEVHASWFWIELNGGKVRVEGLKTTPFTLEDHRELADRGLPNFKAEERLVKPGARVAIKGKLARSDAGFSIRADQIHLLEDQRTEVPPRTRPTGRRRR